MPCTSCGTEFRLLKKEHTCKNCGFTFCRNCLTKKSVIPKLGPQTKHSVCSTCFNLLNKSESEDDRSAARFSPPLALQRRMNALQELDSHPSSFGSKQFKNEKDAELAMRLEKLRKERQVLAGPLPSTSAIEERLAKLKGTNVPSDSQPTSQVFCDERRSAVEQASDLYKQMEAEIAIDAKRIKPEDEIANRLAKLKQDDEPWNDLNKPGNSLSEGCGCSGPLEMNNVESDNSQTSFRPGSLPNNISGDYNDNMNMDEVKKLIEITNKQVTMEAARAMDGLKKDKAMRARLADLTGNRSQESNSLGAENENLQEEDDDVSANKLIEKLLAEQDLDEDSCMGTFKEEKLKNTADDFEVDDADELPWCNICNEDATLRCLECDGELYCWRCFKECHDSFEIKDHRTKPYKSK